MHMPLELGVFYVVSGSIRSLRRLKIGQSVKRFTSQGVDSIALKWVCKQIIDRSGPGSCFVCFSGSIFGLVLCYIYLYFFGVCMCDLPICTSILVHEDDVLGDNMISHCIF